uniref:Integral membrane protein GPR180-like n=1 Tax=Saccoglossus kowalevskii TaxID=10224 RepID=A0ABM0MXG6_SACKO|nr:PREDICTED: integral membrane protein GPR180-like [Saccoglossus kowalevskii]
MRVSVCLNAECLLIINHTYDLDGISGNVTLAHFIHPKVWHIVYGDEYTCKDDGLPIVQPVKVSYQLKLLNPDTLGNPTDHFSDEESGLLEFYQIFVILYFVLLCIFASEIYLTISKRGPMYLVLKMLSTAMALEVVEIICMFLHLYGYSKDGVGSPTLQTLSQLFVIGTYFQMLYLLLSLSFGWTLGSGKVHIFYDDVWKSRPVVPISIVLSLYQGILLLWELFQVSEHKVYNAYENTAGVLHIIIGLLLAAIFAGNIYNTVSIERSALRREFYKNFAKICLIWFLSYPVMVVTSFVFTHYLRYKVITVGVKTGQTCAMILLYKLFLSRSLYWEVSALSASTLPRMNKTVGIKLYN